MVTSSDFARLLLSALQSEASVRSICGFVSPMVKASQTFQPKEPEVGYHFARAYFTALWLFVSFMYLNNSVCLLCRTDFVE